MFFGKVIFAAGKSQFDVGIGMHYYSGVVDESLAPKTAVGLRLGALSGEGMFRWFTAVTIFSSSGNSNFDDAGTSTALDYTLLAGEFDIGGAYYPFGGSSKLPVQ